ncbi:MAG: ECF-type sigma factor [Wenzhouxiangellaceae bacterium]
MDDNAVSNGTASNIAANGWPECYKPEWFAEQTTGDDSIFLKVYNDLRIIARGLLANEYGQPSLQATELVNEAFIKLLQNPAHSHNKRHLLNILARYMRQVLIDRGRRRGSLKRSADLTGLDTHIGREHSEPDWELFDHSLNRLQQSKPLLYEVFQLHYFSGMPLNEIGVLLECSERTVKRYWMAAKLWLTDRIAQADVNG